MFTVSGCRGCLNLSPTFNIDLKRIIIHPVRLHNGKRGIVISIQHHRKLWLISERRQDLICPACFPSLTAWGASGWIHLNIYINKCILKEENGLEKKRENFWIGPRDVIVTLRWMSFVQRGIKTVRQRDVPEQALSLGAETHQRMSARLIWVMGSEPMFWVLWQTPVLLQWNCSTF